MCAEIKLTSCPLLHSHFTQWFKVDQVHICCSKWWCKRLYSILFHSTYLFILLLTHPVSIHQSATQSLIENSGTTLTQDPGCRVRKWIWASLCHHAILRTLEAQKSQWLDQGDRKKTGVQLFCNEVYLRDCLMSIYIYFKCEEKTSQDKCLQGVV